MIRAVTFDCWGTLITDGNFRVAWDERLRALTDVSGGRLRPDEARDLLDRAWREHHHRWIAGTQHGSPGIARYCTAELGLDDPKACDVLQEAFEEAGRLGGVTALDGAADTLRTLREAGVRTALVCDAGFTPGRVVRDFLSDYGLLDNLEFCAFSDEVGEPKPNASIFRAALNAIDTAPSEAAHVGDLLRTDVHGARALGMKTVRITAVNDDRSTNYSWDANASFGTTDPSEQTVGDDVDDADEIVASHTELLVALKRLGAAL